MCHKLSNCHNCIVTPVIGNKSVCWKSWFPVFWRSLIFSMCSTNCCKWATISYIMHHLWTIHGYFPFKTQWTSTAKHWPRIITLLHSPKSSTACLLSCFFCLSVAIYLFGRPEGKWRGRGCWRRQLWFAAVTHITKQQRKALRQKLPGLHP